ncbi:hypothetical protein OSTOST_15626, partial [Ostertagia ostertagi]
SLQLQATRRHKHISCPDELSKLFSSDFLKCEQDFMVNAKHMLYYRREIVPGDEKIEKQLVGVGDEVGLKKMMESDEETDSDEEDLTKKLLHTESDRKKEHLDIEERDSSGSDTDDPDKEKIDSVVFMPKKDVVNGGEPGGSGVGKKRPAEPETSGTEVANDAKRAKVETPL